jgi:phospholipase/carboxylesterase
MPPHVEALIVQRPPGRAQQLVLLLHGLGADEHDLRGVGDRLACEYPGAMVVSLRAPEPCDFGAGSQWISPTALDDAQRVRRVAAAVPALLATVRRWQADCGLGPEATVLVGFSQGAMMALEAAAAATDDALAGRVVALAGRYARLPDAAPARTTVFLVHGKADDVVHYGFTVEAARHLVALDADVVADVLPFVGHEIPDEMLDLVIERLKTHVPRRHWEDALRGAPPATGDTQ